MARSLKDYQRKDAVSEEDMIREAIDARSGRSKAELLDELAELTRQERDAGRMDNMVMDDIYEKLSPMLTEQQRQKMQQVLSRLKE
jgi:RecA/RadA recombinase